MEKPTAFVNLVEMTPEQESALWRQRFFEAQAGMQRFLAERYGTEEISHWLPLQAELVEGLNGRVPDARDVNAWKKRYFRAQALLEKYLADRHSLEDIEGWTAAIGQIFRYTEPNRGGGAADLAVRLAKQAQCYGSLYDLEELGQDHARFRIHHCAIWDYREEARRLGVPLTLKSPCTFCTRATTSNINSKGYEVAYKLHESETDHGCTWEISRKAE